MREVELSPIKLYFECVVFNKRCTIVFKLTGSLLQQFITPTTSV